MSPREFGELTIHEYDKKVRGHVQKEARMAWWNGQFSGMGDPKKYPSLQTILDSLGE